MADNKNDAEANEANESERETPVLGDGAAGDVNDPGAMPKTERPDEAVYSTETQPATPTEQPAPEQAQPAQPVSPVQPGQSGPVKREQK